MNIKYFSDVFNLKVRESEFEFVDIPVNTDTKQYVDAQLISKTTGKLFVDANNTIVDYFERLLLLLASGTKEEAICHLRKLGEPNETHFGLSTNKPDGCGIGKEQAELLYNKLKNSRAVQTGHLKDLSDCELLIHGIGSDKISDITTNIIRGQLIEFTEEQCKKLGIPVRLVKSGYYWDSYLSKWVTRMAYLPHYDNNPILLVPKCIARRVTVSDYRHFYNHEILDFYESWHISMNTSLVKVLRNGKRKVRRKDLRAMYKCSKAFVLEFVEQYPEVLQKYKNRIR